MSVGAREGFLSTVNKALLLVVRRRGEYLRSLLIILIKSTVILTLVQYKTP